MPPLYFCKGINRAVRHQRLRGGGACVIVLGMLETIVQA